MFCSRSLRNCLLVRHYPDTEWCFIFRNVLLAAARNLRGLFDRAVMKISIKIEYAEIPLSSASLIAHPVDSQFVKEHGMIMVRQVNQISYPCLSCICCELDIQGMLMTTWAGLPLISPDLLVDRSVHDYVFHQLVK